MNDWKEQDDKSWECDDWLVYPAPSGWWAVHMVRNDVHQGPFENAEEARKWCDTQSGSLPPAGQKPSE
jgi:hypothetical protein